MNELAQLVALMREMNERLKRIEENTRPAPYVLPSGVMHYPADFDGTHHVAEPEPVTQAPQTCPDCAGSGANQNGSEWDCCDTCKGRKVI